MAQTKADYGIDAPRVMLNVGLFSIAGLAAVGVGAVMGGTAGTTILITGAITAVIGVTETAWMLYGTRKGKFVLRDKILDRLQLSGDERILDVGCGRGMFLVGAANRLTTGRATGLDIWQKSDQSGNDPAVTLSNASAEGVADRIAIQNGDMRDMPFEDGAFDLVVSCIAIHNVPDSAGREKAIREIARVVKSGGRIALVDFIHVRRHGDFLRELGWEDVHVSGLQLNLFPPVRVLTATKP